MAHSNLDETTRSRARTLRRDRTKDEQIMRDLLRDFRARGARFRRETPIGPYIADFAWLSARIVIEVDGNSHETNQGRLHDRKRDAFLTAQGFTVIRFDNDQVIDNPDYVCLELEKRISRFLKDGGDE
jgi:very-short-patch-repair endonuclease